MKFNRVTRCRSVFVPLIGASILILTLNITTYVVQQKDYQVASKQHSISITSAPSPVSELSNSTKIARKIPARNKQSNKKERKIVKSTAIRATEKPSSISINPDKSSIKKVKGRLVTGSVGKSFITSAVRIGVPSKVANTVVNAFSNTIDFQKEIGKGAPFKVLYDPETEHLLYASLTVRGEAIEIYRHEPHTRGDAIYLRKDGSSVRRTLLKVPVKSGVMGSGYGMRIHPIYGCLRMHKGLDYRAPRGAPIFAAGDGVIKDMRYHGQYGRYVEIKHNKTYTTFYAHLGAYAAGLYLGKPVKQGQVIGYVGKSGAATGYHVHYEIRKNGVSVNPIKEMAVIHHQPLVKQQLVTFKKQQIYIHKAISSSVGN